MKQSKIIILFLAALALVACDKDEDMYKVLPAGQVAKPALAAHDAITIDADNLTTSTTFGWEATSFGVPAAIEYTLYAQVGSGESTLVNSTFETSLDVKLEDLNRIVIAAGGEIDAENTVAFTISASISKYYESVLSAPLSIQVKTYKAKPVPLYIAGNLLVAGWMPGNPLLALKAVLPADDFEGMVDLQTDGAPLEFKFCSQPNWDGPNYGGSKNALDPDGGNIADLEAGYYRLIVNSAKTKITAALKIETIGVIGNGVPGDWGSETKLSYDRATNTWVAGKIPLTNGGEFLFRINDSWDYKIGAKQAGQPGEYVFGGDNITVTVPTGNYKMILDANVLPYAIELTPVN